MRKTHVVALALVASSTLSTGALAHTGHALHEHTSFMAGWMHPWLGVDHLLAMLAVGAWSALTAARADATLLRGPLAFANLLLLGSLLGLQGVGSPAVEPLVAASVLVLGLLVLTGRSLGHAGSMALAGGFAVFHGLAHGTELGTVNDPVLAIAGMTLATLVLHGVGLAAGWALRGTPWARRLAGSAVAASGLGLLLQLG